MIGRLTGRLLRRAPDRILLDVGGVGYEVQIPLSTFYALPHEGGAAPVGVHVHTHVRDDALLLFGFATEDERGTFEQLIRISGIGPRLALAILSGIGVDELRSAVIRHDRDRLERIPGIGKKTAERVLLELRDKFGAEAERISAAKGDPASASGAYGAGSVRNDAISALVNLGYSRQVAARAVGAAADAAPDSPLEAMLKAALGGLVRHSIAGGE